MKGALLAGLGLGVAALISSVPASADPPAPDPAVVDPAAAPPAYVPPRAGIGSVLAQSDAAPAGPLGLPDLSAYAPGLILGQNAVPSAPGAAAPVAAPDLRAFNSEYLLPQNVAPAAPGEGVPAAGIGPTPEDPSTGRLAFLRRLHAMYSDGDLDGALLGQMPDEQLGQPLPGTAPAAGIYLPPGLGLTTPEPAAPTPPA
ncbi:hypothetical protein [Mycobacterium sp. M26]|uniref:hypothetical protein n=1 Tax=Mycobacterium sp. M26 TaxID=1762962 RepID=UPI00073E28BD|nr:hypothetical protein [Mycobacterium sp. M26]